MPNEQEFEVRQVRGVTKERLNAVIQTYIIFDRAEIKDVKEEQDKTYTLTIAVPKKK